MPYLFTRYDINNDDGLEYISISQSSEGLVAYKCFMGVRGYIYEVVHVGGYLQMVRGLQGRPRL